MNASFIQKWLDTDTYIDKLNPIQAKRVRELCEKFYEAGRRAAWVSERESSKPAVTEEPTL
jgi:hypothetical protein